MNIVLLQGKIEQEEINKLLVEFSNYLFLTFSEATYKNLRPEDWKRVEILYGSRLTREELLSAPQLRWIHTPTPSQKLLCMDAIIDKGNILVTATEEFNDRQVSEYVMSGILSFSKNLFHWRELVSQPTMVWDSKWRESMWRLESKTLLIIGLDDTASEIGRYAKFFGIKVIGIKSRKAFHPNCDKVYSYHELHSILPYADIICLNGQDLKPQPTRFGKTELQLVKNDSILISLKSNNSIDTEQLVTEATNDKFRGILIDATYQIPIHDTSPLWKIRDIIISPDVAPRPKSIERLAYKTFRYNLRQYQHGNFTDMKNIVRSTSVATNIQNFF